MTLAAIVVTYNRLAPLKVTIDRLLSDAADHIIIVNNASTDDTAAWLNTQINPRLHIITLATNIGGAGGFEAGMSHARDTLDPDWVVLMDDDARPAPDALACFARETSNIDPKYGCIAAAVFYPDGKICEMNRPSRNPFWNLGLFAKTLFTGSRAGFHLSDAAFAPNAGSVDIDVASFVGYFVSRDAVAKVGLPEGGLFIYGDDVLYSLRLRRAGLHMAMNPAVQFEHACGTLGDGFVYRPIWKIYYHCRNGVTIARQAAGPFIFPAALLYYIAVWWRRGRHCTPAERPAYRKMMWAGLRDGLLGRRGRNDAIHQD
jgi:rhamnopyranosyl-N-acetylglucosaminyl-diphospho-decaprenol beta-1,3/1,4-galactofuranosyltransferase